MTTSDSFRRMFRGVALDVEDLFLLEAFQIAYLPGWAPERELAAVLHAYPAIRRFLVAKCSAVEALVDRAMAQFGPARDAADLAACGDELVWSFADLLVYNKCPEGYDRLDFHRWDFAEITTLVDLEGATIIDAGAGTGRVALEAAGIARHVFAVEPVGRLRTFIREKAAGAGLENLYVIDGFSHAIPLPDHFADVLITSHALGWRLEDELAEFERVVKAGSWVIHCPGTAEISREDEQHLRLISADWGYQFARYREADGWKRKYWKRL